VGNNGGWRNWNSILCSKEIWILLLEKCQINLHKWYMSVTLDRKVRSFFFERNSGYYTCTNGYSTTYAPFVSIICHLCGNSVIPQSFPSFHPFLKWLNNAANFCYSQYTRRKNVSARKCAKEIQVNCIIQTAERSEREMKWECKREIMTQSVANHQLLLFIISSLLWE